MTLKPVLRILAPVSDEERTVTASPPPQDLDGPTTEGIPIVSVPDGDMPPPTTKPPVVTAVVQPAPDDALPTDGEINGQVIKRLREQRGLSLDVVAEQTKIRRAQLTAIEEQQLEHLPTRVYLRGYLTQIARVLKVDRDRLAEGYLSFVDRFKP